MHLDMRYKYSAYCAQCRLMFENGESNGMKSRG